MILYEGFSLYYIFISLGTTITLEIWNGWCELICAAISGQFDKVISFLSRNISEARYQVCLSIHIKFGSLFLFFESTQN